MPRPRRASLAASAAVLAAFATAGCGEREAVVSEPATTSPSARGEAVIDAFARATGDDLVAVERDPDAIGFPGDADASTAPGVADLLVLDSEAGPVTSSARYGSFVLNVTTAPTAFEELTSGASAGGRPGAEAGTIWERVAAEGVDGEEVVTWVAHKRYGDVVLSWRSSERRTDAAFERLDRALSAALVGPKGGAEGGEGAPAQPG